MILTCLDHEGITFNEVMPLGPVNGIELSPCHEDEDGYVSVCHNGETVHFYSVYLHYKPYSEGEHGGVECIADFKAEEHARAYAQIIASLLGVTITQDNI
jgi:hypothetical protein